MILFNATQKAYYALIPFFILCAALLGLFGCNADASDSEDSSESAASAPQTQYYHIIFHRNDGEMDVTVDVPVPTGTKFVIPDCTDDRIGFEPTSISVFKYWNTEANDTGDTYEIGAKYKKPKEVKAGESIDLYAIWNWQPGGYTIVFNANGGSGDMSSQYVSFGWRTLSANTFTRTGYNFTGWNTKSDGTGTSYTNSQSVLNLSTENGASVTLYAQWRINKYTVVFDANGGSGNMDNQTMLYGESKALTLCAFTNPPKIFGGWSKNEGSSVADYQDGETVCDLTNENNGLVNLYAVWEDVKTKYTFNLNGGKCDGSTKDIIVEGKYNTNVNVPSNPTRPGYTFSGWDPEVPAKFGEIDKTFTAQWTAHNYTIQFNKNGGSGSMSSLSMTYGTSAVLPANK
ncbi:MAG: InlB B-repeat-containing protein, partial [Spirochaetales bacterium]|nr:InlB B-repeat-containing protein [Spirochaetales bacterium]